MSTTIWGKQTCHLNFFLNGGEHHFALQIEQNTWLHSQLEEWCIQFTVHKSMNTVHWPCQYTTQLCGVFSVREVDKCALTLATHAILMSATTPNTCKLAVYEREVPWKALRFWLSQHLRKKSSQRHCSCSDVKLRKTNRHEPGQVCVRFGPGI